MTPAPPPDRATRWPRDVWMDAIWDCETLTPPQRAVAYTFARYAGHRDTSWCPQNELRKRTGMKSRTAISDAVKSLVDGGWLMLVEKARQHRSARYRMVVRGVQMSTSRTSKAPGFDPDVHEVDIPDVHLVDPDVHLMDSDVHETVPISLTDYSNGSLGPEGHAAPRTPLRQTTPSGRSNETATPIPEVVTDQADLATQPTTRARAENVVDFASRKNRTPKSGTAS